MRGTVAQLASSTTIHLLYPNHPVHLVCESAPCILPTANNAHHQTSDPGANSSADRRRPSSRTVRDAKTRSSSGGTVYLPCYPVIYHRDRNTTPNRAIAGSTQYHHTHRHLGQKTTQLPQRSRAGDRKTTVHPNPPTDLCRQHFHPPITFFFIKWSSACPQPTSRQRRRGLARRVHGAALGPQVGRDRRRQGGGRELRHLGRRAVPLDRLSLPEQHGMRPARQWHATGKYS